MFTVRVQPPGFEPPLIYEAQHGPFDIGRLPATDAVPRCIVAGDPSVSRHQVRIIEDSPGQVRVTNTSQRVPIRSDGGLIPPGETLVLVLPTTFIIGKTTVTLDRPADDDRETGLSLTRLASSPILEPRPGRFAVAATGHDPAVVAGWFETLIAVQRAPAGSKEFYAQTARALVEQIGMDIGLVLLRKPAGWAVTARHASASRAESLGREFSATVLEKLFREKRTIYQSDDDLPRTESLVDVKALVASPVLLPSGDVAGALYGVRRSAPGGRMISSLEAQMVQVLATAVGVGLARVAQEEETARLRVQLHQQFNDRLVSELEADLGRLDPQDRDITIMFADIHGFSRISERLGAAETFQFVSEVMEVMTESVKRHDGAIMDYVGDELIALWNAPADHVEHAWLAVGCALGIATDLSGLSASWHARLGEPVSVGVGLNSGAARVGNTGTRSKPKYGALGHTVNVASRVEGATKAFRCPILVTGSTRDRLPASATVRRLGKVKVVGISEAVELFQPLADPAETPAEVVTGYAEAQARFEAGDLAGTHESLKALLATPAGRADGATLQLAARVESLVRAGTTDYLPVIELSSK